jgi:hypothetical protein
VRGEAITFTTGGVKYEGTVKGKRMSVKEVKAVAAAGKGSAVRS